MKFFEKLAEDFKPLKTKEGYLAAYSESNQHAVNVGFLALAFKVILALNVHNPDYSAYNKNLDLFLGGVGIGTIASITRLEQSRSKLQNDLTYNDIKEEQVWSFGEFPTSAPKAIGEGLIESTNHWYNIFQEILNKLRKK